MTIMTMIDRLDAWFRDQYPLVPFDRARWANVLATTARVGYTVDEIDRVLMSWDLDRAPLPSEIAHRFARLREAAGVALRMREARANLAEASRRQDNKVLTPVG